MKISDDKLNGVMKVAFAKENRILVTP